VGKTDVLVVGAGPVGLYMAGLLEKSGLSVRILEEHKEIGRPNHCSGLVSRNLGRFVRPSSWWIEHEVSGAFIRAGSASILLKKPGTAAYVIDRQKFDSCLAEGLDVTLGVRVDSLKEGVSGRLRARNREEGAYWKEGASRLPIAVKTNNGVSKAEMLIGCDGANSVVARHFGSRPKKRLMGVIGITRGEDYSPDVEIMIDKSLAKDGFFWKIPRGRTTEYGLFGSDVDFLTLERFFGIRPDERRAGLIPLGPGKTYFERAMLVGDAAGMSKPWSGGGLIYGLTAAKIAAETACQAFNENDFSEGFLARYEKGWKKEIGRQIQAGMLGRKVFEGMGDFEVGLALGAMRILNPLINGMNMDFLL
jgi:digeranylgeranylglycerophospholipid reductase